VRFAGARAQPGYTFAVRISRSVAALALSLAVGSCATGATLGDVGVLEAIVEGGTVLESGTSGTSADDAAPGRYASDSGARSDAASRDAAARDGASTDSAPLDAASSDAGGEGGTVRTDLCVGSASQQVTDPVSGPIDYDDLCDAYYTNTGGQGKPCGASGASCATFNGTDGFNQYCCFVPPQTGSFCRADYGGQAQCLPK
jgi:hypothetical protein